MDRRSFLAGSAALAGQPGLLHAVGNFSLGEAAAQQLVLPRNLLSSTYTEAFLASKLVSAGQWHPYPRCSERGAWQAVPADLRAGLVERAQADQKAGWSALLASTFLDFKRNGNRTRFEAASFGRRGQLLRLVLAECVEGQGRFLDDIANGIWLICEESFWGVPAHLGAQHAGVGLPDVNEPIIELFGAATAQLLAWTKYLVGEQLDRVSPMIGKRITLETERRILAPARDRNDFSWMGLDGKDRRLNNWNPWINSNLLVANLILEEDAKVRVKETLRIVKSLDAFLNQYWPDAAEEEGPGYFSVSVACYFECVSFLESATGNATNILANPFIDAMGRFILNAHIAGGDYIDYGDAHVHAAPEGALLYRFGKAVHDEQLAAFGAWCAARDGWTATGDALARALHSNQTSMSRVMPAMLQASEIRSARQQDVMLRDSWYPNLGLMIARQKADSADGMYVAVLAANNGRSHSHNDTGSFIVYQDGEPVAIDVGVEAYTAKTFSPERYSIWTMQSAFHNLPTIGGVMQQAGEAFRATGQRYESDDRKATLSFNLALAYPKEAGVMQWIRTITLDRTLGKVTIEESFDLDRPRPVSLSIMTPRVPVADKNGVIYLKPSKGAGNPTQLLYDFAQLGFGVERIPLTDSGLRESWGAEIYRILLNTNQQMVRGELSYSFSPAI